MKTPSALVPLAAAAIACIAAFTGSAGAQTVIWDGGPSGTGTELFTAANWENDTLPTGATVGIINTSIVNPLPNSVARKYDRPLTYKPLDKLYVLS